MIQILNILFVLFLGIACVSVNVDGLSFTEVAPLPTKLKECSGLIHIGKDTFIGLNDSGNPAELLLFTLGLKSVNKSIKVSNATNQDWEEMTMDEQYIYIGDTGNNAGTRKDLTIYRISKSQVLSEPTVTAEKITFTYPEQESFSAIKKHNFDCESMVCVGDSLYLFTKNRENHRTDLYGISKLPGDYKARHLGQFDAQGLVTGAAFRNLTGHNELALIGYNDKENGYHPFIIYFNQVEGTNFFGSPSKRFTFKGKEQTETILFFDDHHVYVTNEGEHGDQGFIYSVNIKN